MFLSKQPSVRMTVTYIVGSYAGVFGFELVKIPGVLMFAMMLEWLAAVSGMI